MPYDIPQLSSRKKYLSFFYQMCNQVLPNFFHFLRFNGLQFDEQISKKKLKNTIHQIISIKKI